MLSPKIDDRDRAKILQELRNLISQNTPELTDGNNTGFALLDIFAYMTDEIITRLNQVPKKNFIAFLNMLGTQLAPAQPARAPVKFFLSEGAPEDVLVPAGTQVATSATDEHPAIIFETEKTMNVTVSQLKAVYSVDPANDQIYDHTSELNSGKKAHFFISSPNQQHTLYLGHENLFNLKPASESDHVNIILRIKAIHGKFDFESVDWEYWGYHLGDRKDEWIPFEKNMEGGLVSLAKKMGGPTKPIVDNPEIVDNDYAAILSKIKKINSEKVFWIRARVKGDLSTAIPSIESVTACIKNLVHPDSAFYNDVPIDLMHDFYPFGKQPNTHDVFYLGSQEGFSKRNAKVTIKYDSRPCNQKNELLLSWEYWNGTCWNRLEFTEGASSSAFAGSIIFKCPSDIMPTEVNGENNFWIRVRIVSGNYGPLLDENGAPKAGTIDPPILSNVIISNDCYQPQGLRYCWAKNNLQFADYTDVKTFRPFQLLEDKNQAVYLGFDKPFANGRISIFFSLEKQEYLEEKKPQVIWSYIRTRGGTDEWVPLQVLDSTDNLTESGTIEFLGPTDIIKKEKFGQELYWIRAEVTQNRFQSPDVTLSDNTKGRGNQESVPQSLLPNSFGPCIPETFFHPKFTVPSDLFENPASPKVQGIYLNATSAIQAETVTEEILGSSDGTANKPFKMSRLPVFSEAIWVQEPFVPETSLNGVDENVKVMDNREVWIRWQAVEDFLQSSEQNRHYIIDRTSGELKFGDGVNGMIPPIGGVIKATYKTGGGAVGNVAAGEIKNLFTSIAFIDRVTNPDTAQGGANTEKEERVLEKAPKRLQHNWRAVAQEDYEWLAKEASRAVARAKCIPNFSSAGEEKSGCISVIIVPESLEDKPMASPGLLRAVAQYLKSRNPASVLSLTVTSPAYLEFSVAADLYVTSMDSASTVRFKAIKQLKEFLHPLNGGYNKQGWDFGKIPCSSDILALLQKIPEVDHVDNLSITVKEDKSGRTFAMKRDVNLPNYTLIFSGTHNIKIQSARAI